MIRDVEPLEGFGEPWGLLTAILEDGTREWRGEIWEEVGPEVMTWRPYPGGPSAGAVWLHLIMVELAWFGLKDDLTEAERAELLWDAIDVDEAIWPDAPAQPMSWYVALQDRYRQVSLAGIKKFGAADEVLGSGENRYTQRWIFGHVIQHEAYHGGQIVMLVTQALREQ
ncbi:hypothetical protein C0431_04720 [bacterium]|nr:hypothetical protein [bacterium]